MEGNYFIRFFEKNPQMQEVNYIALPFQVEFNFRCFNQCCEYWAEAKSGQQGKLTNEYTKKTPISLVLAWRALREQKNH